MIDHILKDNPRYVETTHFDRKIRLISDMTRQAPFDMNDVVKWTNRLLPHIVSAQSRYKVAEEVTIRIVRYYLTKALISKPDGYKGRNAQFGSHHVIQILAIKYLQAQYIPLKKIGLMMKSTSEAALRSWLLGEGLSDQTARPSLDGPAPSDYVGLLTQIPSDGTTTALDDRTWKRFPIHQDIELHLASRFNLFDHQPGKQRDPDQDHAGPDSRGVLSSPYPE